MNLDKSSLHLQVLSEVRRILISRYTVTQWHLRERPPHCASPHYLFVPWISNHVCILLQWRYKILVIFEKSQIFWNMPLVFEPDSALAPHHVGVGILSQIFLTISYKVNLNSNMAKKIRGRKIILRQNKGTCTRG